MTLSLQEILALIFAVLVAIWLFSRPRDMADRWFLAIAGLIYIAVMAAGYLFLSKRGGAARLGSFLLYDTTGFLLVAVSRKLLKARRRQTNAHSEQDEWKGFRDPENGAP